MQNCIIIVPLYKKEEDWTYDEHQSIKRLMKVLGKSHTISVICPENLDTSFYSKKYQFTEFIQFNDKYFESTASYSKLLLNPEFYKVFESDYEFMLIYQPDAWVFRDELDYWCNVGYDFIGAPHIYQNYEWVHAGNCGNGGFSLRRISWMISELIRLTNVRNEFKDYDYPEDFFIRDYFKGNLAPLIDCARFSFELLPHIFYQVIGCKIPFGCHAYNTVMDKDFYKVQKLIEYEDD